MSRRNRGFIQAHGLLRITVAGTSLMNNRLLLGSIFLFFLVLGVGAQEIDFRSDEDLCSFTQNPGLLENGFAVARVMSDASVQPDGGARVLFANGIEASSGFVLATRKAAHADIELWKWVLFNENFEGPLTETAYRQGAWYFGLITAVEDSSRAITTATVNGVPVPLDWIRVTEEPVYVDLRGKEVLCAVTNEPKLSDNVFAAATVKTSASEKTGNQAQVVFYNGFTGYTSLVLPTHRAGAEELQIGDTVLFNEMFYQPITESRYRFSRWYVGRVTSTQQAFKGIVEVNGVDVSIAWIRVQDASDEPSAAALGPAAGAPAVELGPGGVKTGVAVGAPEAAAVLPGVEDEKPTTVKPKIQPPARDALPAIAGFSADPATVEAGGSVVLRWRVFRADRVSLDGQSVPSAGERSIVINETTTYTLEARSGELAAKDSVTVYVRRGNTIQPAPLEKASALLRALPEAAEVVETAAVRAEMERLPAAKTRPAESARPGQTARPDEPAYARILLDSLYCVSESDWDHGTNSDEPYAIVTGFTTYTEPLSWNTGVPQVFGDVDDGDNRQFTEPQRLVFEGEVPPGAAVGFSVVLMEQDGWGSGVHAQIGDHLAGDTGEFLGAYLVGMTGTLIGGPALGAIGAGVGALMGKTFEVLWDLLGGGKDDKVADGQVVVGYDQLEQWAAEGPHKTSIMELDGGSSGRFWIRWHVELEEDGTRAFAHRFTHWDGFAAGDLLGDAAEEMVVAVDEDAGGDFGRYYIINSYGTRLNTFDRHFDHNDRVVCGDVLGDGRDEIICASNDDSGTIYVFAANGQELARFSSVFTKYDGLAVGNVTADAKEEIVVARDQDDDFTVYSGEGSLLRRQSVAVDFDGCRYTVDHPDSNRHDGFLVGDVTGDDFADIVFIDKQGDTGRVHVFDFFGRSYRAPFEIYLSNKDGMALGDLDGDSKDEVLVATDGADDSLGYAIRIYDVGTGERTATRFYPCFTRYDGFACGDVLGTGRDQVLVATDEHDRIGIAK